jgi:hypothetical protein
MPLDTEPDVKWRMSVDQSPKEKRLIIRKPLSPGAPMAGLIFVLGMHRQTKLPVEDRVAKLEKLLGDASEGKRNEP